MKQYLAEKLRAAQDKICDLEEQLAAALNRLESQAGSFAALDSGQRAIAGDDSERQSAGAIQAYIRTLEIDNQLLRESLLQYRRQATAAETPAQDTHTPSRQPAARKAAREILLAALQTAPVRRPRAVSPITSPHKRKGASPSGVPAVPSLIITSGARPPAPPCDNRPTGSAVTPGIFFRSLARAPRAADVCQAPDRASLESAFEAANAGPSGGASPSPANSKPASGATFIDRAFAATVSGDLDGLCALLQQGLDVDVCSRTGTPLLVAAAEAGKSEVVARLLEEGADPTLTDASGHGPLTAAMQTLEYGVVQLLVQAGVQW